MRGHWTFGVGARMLCGLLAIMLFWWGSPATWQASASDEFLRLVPFPKHVPSANGSFDLGRPLVLEAPRSARPAEVAQLIQEIERAGLPIPQVVVSDEDGLLIRLSMGAHERLRETPFRDGATAEDYQLSVGSDTIACRGFGPAGRFYAVQTLCQLIRANRRGTQIPCVEIRDWPSLRWRCFQDDLTRGPSSKLSHFAAGARPRVHFSK